ncbi:ArsR family metal-binding transcriptional regulator [Thermodesulfitimonas autotrophica]|uniref:ArsR family metal-binding transcriptional regulator n=1 Tax=Thermodesulfitimonas autotrophica TaxID=1894989 RepID=A0A3N5BFK5_9THEO|nr:(Fe-S)-binding protein [Thermodesulfitimonas autotrophica]RPF46872.1 ArsR family metal-binding transcriptional regulator [Thermodesulfitimonas autotrophica]
MFGGYTVKMVRPICALNRPVVAALVEIDTDIREVFPYLNAELGNCFFNPETPFLRFSWSGKGVILYPNTIGITGLADEAEAHRMVEALRQLLTETWARRTEIEPSYRRGSELTALDVYKLLPRSNCGRCGERTCLAFAARLLKQEMVLSDCPPLTEPGREETRERLTRLLRAAGFPA